MLRSEQVGIEGSGQWTMGQPPGPGRPAETHSFAGDETEHLRRQLAEKEAELEGYRGKRETADEGEAPVYKLLTPMYLGTSALDLRIFDAGSIIEFHDVPNHISMVPMNDAAVARMEAELEHQRSCQAEVFAASGAGHGGGLISDLHELLAHQQQQVRRVANEATRHPVTMPTEQEPPHPSGQAHLAKRQRGRPKKQVRDVTPADAVA